MPERMNSQFTYQETFNPPPAKSYHKRKTGEFRDPYWRQCIERRVHTVIRGLLPLKNLQSAEESSFPPFDLGFLHAHCQHPF